MPHPDDSWKCLRCNQTFKPKHATRAAAHFAKKTKMGIKACPATVSADVLKRYVDLFESIVCRADTRKRGSDQLLEYSCNRQDSAVISLIANKVENPPSSLSTNSAISTLSADSPKKPRRIQCSINGYLENKRQSDIRTTINARLEMAIADLILSDNLPDRVVESPRFQLVLQHARFVDSTFKIPSRKKIGGELLDINYKSCMEMNQLQILSDAPIFGLSWLSDGATIARMPLINTLAMCSNVPPTCVTITDCSGHIGEGGKKDAPFIAALMEDAVLKYDPQKLYTDLFYFDGASNVAKAGRVLEAKFPRAYALHGGEHVVSLFFDDLSKHKVVKVRFCFYCLFKI